MANEQSRQPLADNAPPVATEAPQVDVEERQRKASAAMQQSEQRVAAVRQTLQNYQEGKTDSPGLITEVADQVMKGGLPFEHAQSILRSTITDWNAVDIDAAFQRVLEHKARRAKQESPTPVPPPTATGLAPQPQPETAHDLQAEAEAQAQAALNAEPPLISTETATKELWQMTRDEALEFSGQTFGKWWLPLEDHDRLVNVPSGKVLVPVSVKRDATKAMRAIRSGDLAELSKLQRKYATETLRDQGGGAGLGKVKQARRGVVALFNAMTEGANRIKKHRAAIVDALSESKSLPAEVLADYPDLANKAQAAPAPQPSPFKVFQHVVK